MDPVSIALAAASLIATKAAEGTGTALGETVRLGIGRVYDAVRSRFGDDPEITESIERVEAKPESKARTAELAETLEARLTSDPELAKQLEDLINEIPDDSKGSGPSFITTVKDNAVVGKLTTIGNVEGNVTI